MQGSQKNTPKTVKTTLLIEKIEEDGRISFSQYTDS